MIGDAQQIQQHQHAEDHHRQLRQCLRQCGHRQRPRNVAAIKPDEVAGQARADNGQRQDPQHQQDAADHKVALYGNSEDCMARCVPRITTQIMNGAFSASMTICAACPVAARRPRTQQAHHQAFGRVSHGQRRSLERKSGRSTAASAAPDKCCASTIPSSQLPSYPRAWFGLHAVSWWRVNRLCGHFPCG